MGQAHRIQSSEILYHVCSRGIDRQPIFDVVDGDRAVCMKLLERTVLRYRWQVHAYCLMGNHFHLVLDTPEANIAAGMRYWKSSYALWFNGEKPREGHLFERRYYAGAIDREAHFFAACRYVVLNPVRAGLCRHPAAWPWSSYRATAGLISTPAFLHTGLLHEYFGGPPAAASRYAQFVADGLPGAEGPFGTRPTSEVGHARSA